MTSRLPDNSGFTLIEMIVTIVVLSVVGFVTIVYVANTAETYAGLRNRRDADAESMAVVQAMRRETRALQTITLANAARVTFVTRQNVTNDFRRNAAQRTILHGGNLLASDAAQFTLSYYNATNGLLTPLPLSAANRDLVRRIALDLTIAKGDQSAAWSVNFFAPTAGVMK